MATKKNAESAVTMYVALSPRNEAGGIGYVPAGQEVDLSALHEADIAQLIHSGYYLPLGELPEEVALILDDMRAG